MNIRSIRDIHLGSGLIGIGRPWGHVQTSVPSETDALQLLATAVKNDIFYFDTAASYGTSEERLGKFLDLLSENERKKFIIATKFGDHWNSKKQEAYVDHSYNALKKSLDRSISFLNQINVLYLHKATTDALQSTDVAKAFAYAKEQGINCFGASVSDEKAAQFVVDSDFYSVIQLPYNTANTMFSKTIDEATRKGKVIVINRPFNMGQTLYKIQGEGESDPKVQAYEFILKKNFHGFILTGTKSPNHLLQNITAFSEAKSKKNEE